MKLLAKISDYRKYRILEMIPGVMVWTTLITALVLSFVAPIVVIYFIIIFDLYWLLRILYMLFYMVISYWRYRQSLKIDWGRKYQEVSGWKKIHHLIIIATYRESLGVLKDTFRSIIKSNYPLKKCIVVLAGEERDKVNFQNIASQLEREFGSLFLRFLITIHPKDIEGEVAGKGSNIAWAGRRAQELIDGLEISYDDIIVTTLDCDSVLHPQYLSYLTYSFLTDPKPTRTSYQPVAIFNNNIWQAPAFTRIVSYSTTFWLLSEQVRPERMHTFSSHSMSFRALVDIDFWQTDIVTEDSRICLQCLMHYDGDYKVKPLYIPISMDVVLGKNFWQTIKAQYVQQRRWAYGIENFPYMIWNFFRNKKMPFIIKFRYIFNQLEGVYSWATAPILIFILGHLPAWVVSQGEYTSIVAQNAPHILQWLMTAAMVGLLIQAILATSLLPPRPKKYNRWKLLFMVIQWLLVPVTLIVFGSIPATEAQTRLMLGKYLGFQVTEKVRK